MQFFAIRKFTTVEPLDNRQDVNSCCNSNVKSSSYIGSCTKRLVIKCQKSCSISEKRGYYSTSYTDNFKSISIWISTSYTLDIFHPDCA